MKNALLNAAMYMSAPFGVRIKAYDLSSKVGMRLPALVEEIKPYAQAAVDMYEIGEEVAMGEAKEPYKSFISFGEWFGNFIREEGRIPTQKEALGSLASCTFASFTSEMTSSQDEILKARLYREVEEYGDE